MTGLLEVCGWKVDALFHGSSLWLSCQARNDSLVCIPTRSGSQLSMCGQSKEYCSQVLYIYQFNNPCRNTLWLLLKLTGQWELQMHPDQVVLAECSHLWIGGELSDPHDLQQQGTVVMPHNKKYNFWYVVFMHSQSLHPLITQILWATIIADKYWYAQISYVEGSYICIFHYRISMFHSQLPTWLQPKNSAHFFSPANACRTEEHGRTKILVNRTHFELL